MNFDATIYSQCSHPRDLASICFDNGGGFRSSAVFPLLEST